MRLVRGGQFRAQTVPQVLAVSIRNMKLPSRDESGVQADFPTEKLSQSLIQLPKAFRPGIQDGEEFISIVLEKGGIIVAESMAYSLGFTQSFL